MRQFLGGFLLGCVVFLIGCDGSPTRHSPARVLRLAVTTSTRDSGLLDELVPIFERQQRARVDVIAVGTGKALKLGQAGDVDVVLVHARAAEDAFMQAGHGSRREDVMFNHFTIVGPPDDPAAIGGLEGAAALRKIAASGQPFVSRGDDSGTHQWELLLWKTGGGRPPWSRYVESGQGMGSTLIMADQMSAYALTDRGTYLTFQKKIRLVPLVSSSQALLNPYGIIVVNAQAGSAVNQQLAQSFVDFIISPKIQRLIRDYKLEGEPLFYPLHLPTEN